MQVYVSYSHEVKRIGQITHQLHRKWNDLRTLAYLICITKALQHDAIIDNNPSHFTEISTISL